MLKIAVVDDTRFDRNKLTECLTRYKKEQRGDFEFTAFDNGSAFFASDYQSFSIIFLDIAMDGMDGMSIARRLRREGSDAIIIFQTMMLQYAVQGYSVDAMDFIVKPVSYTGVRLRLDRAFARLEKTAPHYLDLHTSRGAVRLKITDINYAESYNHKVLLHLKDRQIEATCTLKALEKSLEKEPFFKCHASFLVNLNQIDRIQGSELSVGGMVLPISRSHYREFMESWTAYLGGIA